MFNKNPQQTIAHYTELKLIDLVKSLLGPVNPLYPQGIGDDCAVVDFNSKEKLILTTDSVIVRNHFSVNDLPGLVGEKLLKRNISDLASMGAKPNYALLSLTLGDNLDIQWFKKFIKGIRKAALAYDTLIVGGDMTSAGMNDYFLANIALTGSAKKPLLRRGAEDFDYILVTGELGGSLLGKHLIFEPRINEGQFLSSLKSITSMIDISDGLSKDLLAILPQGSYAMLNMDKLPISLDAKKLGKKTGKTSLEHVMNDGEDYELLFTLNSKYPLGKFLKAWESRFKTRVTCIGQILPGKTKERIQFKDSGGFSEKIDIDFSLQGYEHWGMKGLVKVPGSLKK